MSEAKAKFRTAPRKAITSQYKTRNGAFIRSWEEGQRVIWHDESADLSANEFSHDRIEAKIRAVDPTAADRYKNGIKNGDLRIFRLASQEEAGGKYAVFYVTFARGSDFPNHSHEHVHATVHIVEGHGVCVLDGEAFPFQTGDVIHIPERAEHEFFAALDCKRVGYLATTSPDIVAYAEEQDDEEYIDWISGPSNFFKENGEVDFDKLNTRMAEAARNRD